MRDRRTHRCACQCGESVGRHSHPDRCGGETPLQQLILFSGKRTRKSVWEARDVLAPDQMSEFRELVCPRQLMEGPAQRD